MENKGNPPEGLDEYLAGLETPGVDSSLVQMPAPEGLDEYVNDLQEEKYGSLGQQAITAVEGAAEGLIGPLAPIIETQVLGVNPEDIRMREETNPITSTVSEIAGFAGPALASLGASAAAKAGVTGATKIGQAVLKGAELSQAGLLTKAGQLAEKAVFGEVAAAPTLINQVGREAVKGAFEGALYQGGVEIGNAFKENPEQTAETAITDIGLSTVLGGVFGGAIGAALRKSGINPKAELPATPEGTLVSQADVAAMERGEFGTVVKYLDGASPEDKVSILKGLSEEKKIAPELRAAMKEHGLPELPAILSENKLVQELTDDLIQRDFTYSGYRTAQQYKQAYNKAVDIADRTLGQTREMSQAELGIELKKSLASKIEAEQAPISALYDRLKAYQEIIPLQKGGVEAALGEIDTLLKDPRFPQSSPSGKFLRNIKKDLPNYATADDIKTYATSVRNNLSATASQAEREAAHEASRVLRQLEDDSVEAAAKSLLQEAKSGARAVTSAADAELLQGALQGRMQLAQEFEGLIALRKDANKLHKQQMEKLGNLAEGLGAKHPKSPGAALDFIENKLTVEDLAAKFATKKDSQFVDFLSKEFPEQYQLARDYQRALIREKAMKNDRLDPKALWKQVDSFEKEIQNHLFTKQELRTLKQMAQYVEAFPKKFNPSGTAAAMDRLDLFSSPLKYAGATLGDFAKSKFIKTFGPSIEIERAQALAQATIRAEKKLDKGVANLFKIDKVEDIVRTPTQSARDKLAGLVEESVADPDKLIASNESNPVPEYAGAFSATSARAVEYLNSIRPKKQPASPLDDAPPVSSTELAAYNRALDIAQQPLVVLNHIKKGMLTPDDVKTLKTIYPGLYSNMSKKLLSNIVTAKSKKVHIPYQTKMQLSLFLGQPLDSSLDPQSVQAIQMVNQMPTSQTQSAMVPKAGQKHTTSGLDKMAAQYQTVGQARSARYLSRK